MDFNLKADLIPLFRGLVTGLKPYAQAQDVELTFHTDEDELRAYYNPQKVLSEITVLLSRVITFTPQSYSIKVSVGVCSEHNENCILTIENTGVDLSKLGEILSSVSNGLEVERKKQGTRFLVTIPTRSASFVLHKPVQNGSLLPKKYPNYYSTIAKRLASHFSNIENMEKSAELKSSKEGVFLKKVNAVINSHVSNPDFKVDTLANAMALSRTQLFRKIKALTQKSPQEYLRFVRLEKAKRLLQSRDKDLNVGEVCYETGFASKSHFTRSFQKEFGFSPSEFFKNKNVT
jgi:AraC-like DNA-binding protein